MRWNLTALEFLLIPRRKIHRHASMPEQVDEEVKKDRQAELMELQQDIALDKGNEQNVD